MTTTVKKSKRLQWIAFLCVIGLIVVSVGFAVLHRRAWNVPATDKEKKNPLSASEANLAAAQKTYEAKCTECHGEKGKGDGSDAMMYDPPPTDLTDAASINKLSDGELYYQITVGRKPMPSYKNKLTDEQRWQLVLLVRAFAAGKSPSGAKAPIAKPVYGTTEVVP
jgi:mono/diheme cytochrome c family protein